MRRLILGGLLGATLSSLRAQAGMTLFQFPAPSAATSYGLRALALLSCALALFHARRLFHGRAQNTVVLLGVTLGFVLHGLFAFPFQNSSSWLLLAALVIAPPLLARLLRRAVPDALPDEPDLATAPLAGLAVCAAGVTLALEGNARGVRLLGSAATFDDTIFGGVFLALVTFGGVAFARTLAQLGANREGGADWGRGRAVEGALVLAAGLTLLSQRGLLGLSSGPGLRAFMHRYGLDTFDNGMFGYDAAIAAAVWIAPAFALGTALGCTRRASELSALCVGAALACLALPLRMAPGPGAVLSELPTGATLIREGILLAALGALATSLLRARRKDGPPLAATLALAGAGFALPLLAPPRPVFVGSPWRRLAAAPDLFFEIGAGQVNVAPGGADLDVLCVDGVYLTPRVEEAVADRNRIVEAMELVDPRARARGVKVLLIGQLTPGRALTLSELGAERIDRTASWHRVMPQLEQRFFTARGHDLPPGDVLTPGTARARLDAYDLVLALAAKGEAPLAPPGLTPGEGPLAVLWIDAGHGVHRRGIRHPVLLAADGVEDLSIALLGGLEVEAGARPDGAAFFAPGAPADRITQWRERLVRPARRHELALVHFAAALAQANADNPLGPLALGLRQHFEVQRRSSLWETREQSVELSAEALATLRDALEQRTTLDRFTREIWGGLGQVLTGKRDVQATYEYLEPLAQRFGPWPELDLALAHADLESLEPWDALERLHGLEQLDGPLAPKALELIGRARAEVGDHAGAAGSLRRLGRIAPSGWQRRLLAIEATLAGEPDGHELLRRALEEEPDDQALRDLLERGIPPAAPSAPNDGRLNH